jgi:hypothetical protein
MFGNVQTHAAQRQILDHGKFGTAEHAIAVAEFTFSIRRN